MALAGCREGSRIAARYYNEGNSLFEKAEFGEAVDRYRAAVEAGAADGELFYNLATAYFQSGRVGEATLWFLRAQRLMPRDRDVADNLAKVRKMREDSLPTPKQNRLATWWSRSLDLLTPREVLWVTTIVYLVLLAALLVRCLWPRRFSGGGGAMVIGTLAVLFAVAAVFAGARMLHAGREKQAVVVVHEVQGRNGPGDEFPAAFTIHEGTEVLVLQRRGAWEQLRLPNRWTGWVRRNVVERV